MSSITPNEIKQEFLRSKIGIAGITILTILVVISIIAITTIPVETFKEWNNPSNWISYPKGAIPVWVNYFLNEKIPEHKILESPSIEEERTGEISLMSHQFGVNFGFDDFPKDFIYEFTAKYTKNPLLQISVIRPDGIKLELVSTSLPFSDSKTIHSERIFSTDDMIKKNLLLQSSKFEFSLNSMSAEDIIFSKTSNNEPLKGNYVFIANLYGTNPDNEIPESRMIIGGKAFGVMGTDELRRDLAIGLLWGTPLALFIGLLLPIL